MCSHSIHQKILVALQILDLERLVRAFEVPQIENLTDSRRMEANALFNGVTFLVIRNAKADKLCSAHEICVGSSISFI